MARLIWIELTLLFAIVAVINKGVRCLKDITLEVIPEVVERGSETSLHCHYDEEGEPVYTVKWYRGKNEFYRFTPGPKPTTKHFPIKGINVDMDRSNESQVTIVNVDFGTTGNYSCEVTADDSFATEAGYSKIVVVSLPQGRPVISAEKERYDPGETLKANCTVPPSKPSATLSFTLNNKPVGQTSTNRLVQKYQKSNHGSNEGLKVGPGSHNVHQQQQEQHPYGDLQWNELNLDLQPFHYANGQLTLRCIVQIPEVYNATAELQLGSGLREPVPERVTSENTGTVSSLVNLILLSLAILHPVLR